jgi:hypothetical protein
MTEDMAVAKAGSKSQDAYDEVLKGLKSLRIHVESIPSSSGSSIAVDQTTMQGEGERNDLASQISRTAPPKSRTKGMAAEPGQGMVLGTARRFATGSVGDVIKRMVITALPAQRTPTTSTSYRRC